MDGLTVAVPTRDRQERLLGALDAIASELRPEDELLVVDNGSTDETGAAAEAFLADCRAGGSSPSLGAGSPPRATVRSARHGIPSSASWTTTSASSRAGSPRCEAHGASRPPNVACIGGPLLPEWQAPRPGWLADYLLYVVSVLDLGGERRRLDQAPRVGYAWGGNMSIRVQPALSLGGFDPDRGVRPEDPSDRGEEEELQRRFAEAGFETWYEPAAAALHLVPPERVTEDYFADAFRARGRSEARAGKGQRPRARHARPRRWPDTSRSRHSGGRRRRRRDSRARTAGRS